MSHSRRSRHVSRCVLCQLTFTSICCSHLVLFQATLSLIGTVLLWLGPWNMLGSDRLNQQALRRSLANDQTEAEAKYASTWLYLCLGWTLSLWADNLLVQANHGTPGTLWHPRLWGFTPRARRWLYPVRWSVGMVSD
jgi:hypothetical protein